MEAANNKYQRINQEVFQYFNESFGIPKYDAVIELGAQLGEQDNFYCYLMIALIIASLAIYNNKHDINTLKEIIISWFTAGVTLFLSLAIGYAFILMIKNYTQMPRPFCDLENVYVVKEIASRLECNMSFPSGHISFLTVMIVSFWPLFNRVFKTLAVALVLFVAVTRMAAGVHYPIDLLGAVIITLPLTLYIHHKVAYIVWRYESKRNIFSKLYSKIFK